MWFSSRYVCVDLPGLFAEAEVSGELSTDDGAFWDLDAIDEVELEGEVLTWAELQARAPSLAHAIAVETYDSLDHDPEYVWGCIQDERERAADDAADLAISAWKEDRWS